MNSLGSIALALVLQASPAHLNNGAGLGKLRLAIGTQTHLNLGSSGFREPESANFGQSLTVAVGLTERVHLRLSALASGLGSSVCVDGIDRGGCYSLTRFGGELAVRVGLLRRARAQLGVEASGGLLRLPDLDPHLGYRASLALAGSVRLASGRVLPFARVGGQYLHVPEQGGRYSDGVSGTLGVELAFARVHPVFEVGFLAAEQPVHPVGRAWTWRAGYALSAGVIAVF